MKKAWILIVGLLFILGGTGCSKTSIKENKPDNKTNIEENNNQDKNNSKNETQKEEEIKPIEKPKPTEITISSVGDIMMHQAQIDSGKLSNGNYDYNIMFRSTKPYIENSIFSMANLETTLSGNEKEYTGYPCFNSPEILAQNIKDAGFDLVTTANNHSLDRKFYGIQKTIENLDNVGLLHTGTFKTNEENNDILIRNVEGIKIAFLAYSYATNGIKVAEPFAVNMIDKNKMLSDIKKAKSQNVDLIIASMHWGVEYQRQPNNEQKSLTDFLFNNGVDIIMGSHPHVLQPMEIKTVKDVYGVEKERFVIYSQGNFVANMPDRYMNSGIIVNLHLKKENNITTLEKVDYIPTWVDAYYNNKEGKSTFEVLPLFSVNDYSNHPQYAKIKQSFVDTTTMMKSDNPKIQLYNK